MRFAFRSGTKTYRGMTAKVVATELEAIRARDGKLEPRAIVDEAIPKDHPLHANFTWDDKQCGVAHRLHEARQLIKELVVFHVESDESEPAFMNVRFAETDDSDADRYYQSTSVLLRSPEEMESALAESRAKLTSAENSFRQAAKLARRVKAPAGRIRKIESVASRLGKTQAQAARL